MNIGIYDNIQTATLNELETRGCTETPQASLEDIHVGTVVKLAWFNITEDPIGNVTSISDLRSKIDTLDTVKTATIHIEDDKLVAGSYRDRNFNFISIFNQPENGITFSDLMYPTELAPERLIVFIESQPEH